MGGPVNYRPSTRVRHGVLASAATVIVVALLGLFGHVSGQLQFAGRIGAFVPMVQTTALSLLVVALAVVVRLTVPAWRSAILAAAAAVSVVAILELIDLSGVARVAPDRLFATPEQMLAGVGRMSPIVAVSLVGLAIALALSYSKRHTHRTTSQWISLMVGNGGFVLCMGYAFGAPLLADLGPWPPAFPAAASLMLLGLATSVLTADRRPLSLFAGNSVRAQLMRAIMPLVVGTALAFAAMDSVHHLLAIEQSPMLAASVPIAGIVAVSLVTIRLSSALGGRIDEAEDAREEALAQLEIGNERLERMVRDVVLAMDHAVEVRDPFTQGHEQRVAQLARRTAEALGMSADDAEGVEMAALLHDVGKLCVPADILSRPGKLSRVEFALVKEHAARGAEILRDIDFPWPIAEVVLQHHERLDGSGYPRGLSGSAIHMYARIIAVCDVIEAMASHRPYRPSMGIEAGIAEVEHHPEQYDAKVASVCRNLYDKGELTFE